MSTKFTSKKSWLEKLNKASQPEVKVGPDVWNNKFGGDRMLIATPKLVDNEIRKIPAGKIATMGMIRSRLASQHQADYTCPLTTGIFARISAEAAEEERASGKSTITPYWRLIKDDGTLNPKFPGGIEHQSQQLEKEGFSIVPKGKKNLMVQSFETHL